MAEQGAQASATSPSAAAPGRRLFSFDNIIVSLIMVGIGFGLGYGACYQREHVTELKDSEQELAARQLTLDKATTAMLKMRVKMNQVNQAFRELNEQSDEVNRQLGLARRKGKGKADAASPSPASTPPVNDPSTPATGQGATEGAGSAPSDAGKSAPSGS